jgi:hypothetical protein
MFPKRLILTYQAERMEILDGQLRGEYNMKKMIFVALVLFAYSSQVVSQERPYEPMSRFVDGMTGQDWILMTLSQQVSVIQGFYLAYSAIWDVFIHNMSDGFGPDDLTATDLQQLEDLFYIEVTIDTARRRIDNYYAEPSRLNILLRDALLWSVDKEYW